MELFNKIMDIYIAKADSNNAQWIIPKVSEEILLDVLSFDCITKGEQYGNFEWYIFNPKEKKGNFYMGVPNALIFDQKVYDSELFTLFEMAGEILPIHLESGEELYALNVLECVNMLNKEDTIYDFYDDGTKGRILNYSFYENRISESAIFKIPETSNSEVLTYSGVHDSEDEFFHLYKKLGFKGLVFKEIW
jgi:hypothetical protein